MDEDQSEFGKGLCYCLGLFLAHTASLQQGIDRYKKLRESNPDLFDENSAVEMWFNAAADHMYDIQPEAAPTEDLGKRVRLLAYKCIGWRGIMSDVPPTLKDAEWAIQESKDLLRLIDAAHNIPTEQGKWE